MLHKSCYQGFSMYLVKLSCNQAISYYPSSFSKTLAYEINIVVYLSNLNSAQKSLKLKILAVSSLSTEGFFSFINETIGK